MKHEHSSAERFFTDEVSKTMGRPIPVAIMWVDFEDIDIPDPPYHKSVSDNLVEEYHKEFNPLVAGFLVCNIRETGKTALVDGRHRRAMAIKQGKKGWWFICTTGLSVQEEAKLFRHFTTRKNMKKGESLRALIIEGDKAALTLRSTVQRVGCCLPHEKDRTKHKVFAVEALIRIFEHGGEKLLTRVLRISVDCWMGNPVSLKSGLLLGLWRFLTNDEVAAKLDEVLFKQVMSTLSPDSLTQRGRIHATQERCGASFGLAAILRMEYNRKARGGKRIDFDFAHAPRTGMAWRNGTNGVHAGGLPDVPEELKVEVQARKDGSRVPASEHMIAHIKAAIRGGHSREQIAEAFGVGDSILRRVYKTVFLEDSRKKKAARDEGAQK